jgi:hypothetical protein
MTEKDDLRIIFGGCDGGERMYVYIVYYTFILHRSDSSVLVYYVYYISNVCVLYMTYKVYWWSWFKLCKLSLCRIHDSVKM